MAKLVVSKKTKAPKVVVLKKAKTAASDETLFFPVAPFKFLVMSTVTFGLYERYWFYKNWQMIGKRQVIDGQPLLKAIFLPIFCYSFCKEVDKEYQPRFLKNTASAALVAITFFLLQLAHFLPKPFNLIGFFSVFPLIAILMDANRVNAEIAPDHDPNARFSGWNIFGVVVGGILFLASVLGTFIHALK